MTAPYLLPAALLFATALLCGCDGEPNIVYVADDDAVHLLQLTDAQGDCDSPRRICYLTSWEGGTVRGCWNRESAYIHTRFPYRQDELVPVGEFRPTERAAYTQASLD